jgi:nickel/cobalt transporter (NicO) family protein
MDATIVLMISAAISAILHTLVPDHEIPLAMIGRTQNWSMKKMAGVAVIAGVIHISVSMGVGVIALVASTALSKFIANSAQQISGVLLIGFGLIYAGISWKRKQGGHWHTHGHNDSLHNHDNDDPQHQHVSSENCSKIGWGTWMVAIVGIAPCFTLIPVLIAAVPYGTTTTLLVMLSYAVSTIGMMVVLTLIALKTIQYISKLHRIEKHMEILAGLVILAVGVWLILEIYLDL